MSCRCNFKVYCMFTFLKTTDIRSCRCNFVAYSMFPFLKTIDIRSCRCNFKAFCMLSFLITIDIRSCRCNFKAFCMFPFLITIYVPAGATSRHSVCSPSSSRYTFLQVQLQGILYILLPQHNCVLHTGGLGMGRPRLPAQIRVRGHCWLRARTSHRR